MSGIPWTQEEIAYVKSNYNKVSVQEIAKHLNRTLSAVYGAASTLGLKKFKYYSQEESEFVKRNFHRMSFREIGDVIGRSSDSVKNHCKDILKIKRTAKQSKAIMDKFSKQTQYKKNNLPHNTRDDGEIGIRGGYKYIRISMRNWVLLHRFNWEQVNGEIPQGYNVVFKNGNAMDCDINNLELVSNAELMQRNTIQRYPPELITSIRLVSKLNAKIKSHEK